MVLVIICIHYSLCYCIHSNNCPFSLYNLHKLALLSILLSLENIISDIVPNVSNKLEKFGVNHYGGYDFV